MFRVPERYRVHGGELGSDFTYGQNGAFCVESPEPGWLLLLIVSNEEGWEHVSVHAAKNKGRTERTPTWREMAFVKDLCWDEEDVVVQLHPRRSEYVNVHRHVLHLWRPLEAEIPLPPRWMV